MLLVLLFVIVITFLEIYHVQDTQQHILQQNIVQQNDAQQNDAQENVAQAINPEAPHINKPNKFQVDESLLKLAIAVSKNESLRSHNIKERHNRHNNKTVQQVQVMKSIMDIEPVKPVQPNAKPETQKSKTPGNETLDPFAPKLTQAEKEAVYNLLSKVHQVMTSSHIVYWIYSGTLLGSYRHHDLIPWDDDVDVITDISTRDKLLEALKKLEPVYTVYIAGNRLKFFLTNAKRTSQFKWTFPYIDISFYKDNGSNVYDYSDNQDMGDFMFVYDKTKLFPLHLRPLGKLRVFAPYDTYANLKATYSSLNSCQSAHYLHRTESLVGGSHYRPCETFKHKIPFVHRQRSDYGILETLKIGSEIMQKVSVREPHYAVTDPYTLQLIQN